MLYLQYYIQRSFWWMLKILFSPMVVVLKAQYFSAFLIYWDYCQLSGLVNGWLKLVFAVNGKRKDTGPFQTQALMAIRQGCGLKSFLHSLCQLKRVLNPDQVFPQLKTQSIIMCVSFPFLLNFLLEDQNNFLFFSLCILAILPVLLDMLVWGFVFASWVALYVGTIFGTSGFILYDVWYKQW